MSGCNGHHSEITANCLEAIRPYLKIQPFLELSNWANKSFSVGVSFQGHW